MKDCSNLNFYEQIDKIVENLLKRNFDPFEVYSMVNGALEQKIQNLIHKEYIRIKIDSPLGKDSVEMIAKNFPDLAKSGVKWDGLDGCRGNTIIYIRNKCLDVTEFIKKLRKIGVLDDISDIVVEM